MSLPSSIFLRNLPIKLELLSDPIDKLVYNFTGAWPSLLPIEEDFTLHLPFESEIEEPFAL